MSDIKKYLGPMRLPFVILAPACAILGIAAAYYETKGHINLFEVILVIIGAVAAHISVNAFNEYDDFKTGLDAKTKRTPFSGGSGTLPANPSMARAGLIIALISLGITGLIGIYFLFAKGLVLLPVGILGLLVIVTYTIWLTRSPILCLIAPGLGFGTLMVIGAQVALTGSYSVLALVVSFVPFFLVSNLLLLNQFPDVEADRSVGRQHLLVVEGKRVSSIVYIAFLVCTYLSILAGVIFQVLPVWCLLGLGTLVIAVPAAIGADKVGRGVIDIPQLVPFMGLNVLINILTPLLVAIGLFLS
jgi:1,4-dihydroxy-2-naphthoate polyprenyltransferase